MLEKIKKLKANNSIPLLLHFMSEIENVEVMGAQQKNSLYNTDQFNIIPFYKPISLMLNPRKRFEE